MCCDDVVTVRDDRIPEGTPMSAGYVPRVARLGVPAQLMSDASLGVTNPGYREGDTATALPAGIALGVSFNPALARASGGTTGGAGTSRIRCNPVSPADCRRTGSTELGPNSRGSTVRHTSCGRSTRGRPT
jgi:hypothetical protein